MSALGVYQQAGDNCTGGDFRCGPKGGILSCRPCDFPQLAVFKDLQAQTNRILAARGIQLPVSMRDGDGRSLLWIDARIGPKTTTAVGLAAVAAEQVTPPSQELIAALQLAVAQPTDLNSMTAVAQYAKEIAAYFAQVANQISAGAAASGTPTPAELLKTPEEKDIATEKQAKGNAWLWWVIGAVVLVGAGGLGYYLWQRSRGGGTFIGESDEHEQLI